MNEIWRDVPGYEGKYQVSNLGRVKSLSYRRSNKEVILKPISNGTGYLQITFCKNGKTERQYVHRLVAEAFIPNPGGLPEVNHKSEVKTENQVWNLEWCTRKYNATFSHTRGRSIQQYSLSGEPVQKWSSALSVEKELGFYSSSIIRCCRGKQDKAYGYRWSYSDEMVNNL